jgi:ABC-2 type transport system ATP-binding protein
VTNTIEIGGISKSFGSHKAIENVTFQVKKGEIFGFLGPNGAGKTTTIRCLMNFITPDTGKIKVLGQDAQASSVAVKNMIGYVASDHHLVEKWTAREHIDYIMHLRGAGGDYRGLLKQFSLDLDRRVKVLSTGNRQKLNLILGLIGEPKVLVLDEPTQGLDPLFQNEVYRVLEDFRESGGTVFISSHNLAEVQRICQRVAIINQGRLVAVENLESLRQKAQYVVRVRSAKPLPKSVLQSEQITIRSQAKHEVTFLVRGDLNSVVKMLAKHKLSDLEITHASLEEVFLEMYS